MTKHNMCDQYRMESIEAFRLGMEGQGSDALVRFIDCLVPFMESNSAMLGQDESELLNLVFAAQQRGDYVFIADILQYVFPNSVLGRIGAN